MNKFSILFLTAILLFLVGLITLRMTGQGIKMPGFILTKKAPPGSAKAEVGMAAIVNGEKITWEELDLRINQMVSMDTKASMAMDEPKRKAMTQQMLDKLIENRLIAQEAARQGIRVTEEEMQEHIKTVLGQFPSKQAFEDLLNKRKTNFQIWTEDVKEFKTKQHLEEKLMEQIEVTDAEIQDYWKQGGEGLIDDKVQVRDILLETEEEVKKVLDELKRGRSFEELAKRYSHDPATKEKGGDLGWVSKASLLKELREPIFALEPGQISPPIKTQAGYFLMKLEAKEISKQRSLADHREHIKHLVRQNKWYGSLQKDWIASLKAKADIWVDPTVSQVQ